MNKAIRFKLFLMMVLEFFIWGAWFPLIFGYLPSLGFSASEPPQILAPLIPKAVSFFFSEQSLILNAFPAAAIVGMFFSNQFADRNFAAEKFLAASHLIGGASMLSLVWVQAFWPFFFLMLVHCLLYVPTISITNSIAFTQMKDAQKEFHRLDPGSVAVHVHSGGLGQSEGVESSGSYQLAGDGIGLRSHR